MKRRSGFTLVELSIVLVILGLLIGGVLTGQSLIRASELRSITTQEQRYVSAIYSFRDKYFALPGDMANASSYWGAADGSTGSTTACATAASTDTKTCNGNGDGTIYPSPSTYVSHEEFRFWQHLANAGLIEGGYDGVPHGSTIYSTTPLNSPQGRISGTLWFPYGWQTITTQSTFFRGEYGNTLLLGGTTADNWPSWPAIRPEEAYNIDVKMDDGKPATGKVSSVATMTGTLTSCTDAPNNSTLTASYLLTNTAISCGVVFRQAY